jgi:predicted permease
MRSLRLGSSGRDLIIALRRLRRTPVFAVTAVVLLGLGLGVGTAFVNIINGVLKARDVDLPGVVRFAVSTWEQSCPCLLNPEDVAPVADQPPDSLAWVIGDSQNRFATARINGTPLSVVLDSVSGPYFSVFGGRPAAGRLLSAADDRESLTPPVVISERLWTRLGRDPGIVGSSAYLSGHPVVIVGVIAGSFGNPLGGARPDVWATSRVLPIRNLYGRLRNGVRIEQANAEIRVRYRAPAADGSNRTLELRPGATPPLPRSAVAAIAGVLLAGGLVVALAVGSLALMLLARVLARAGEIGIQLMLGAGVWDVVRLWVAEVAVIAAAGATMGVLLGAVLARQAISFVQSQAGFSGIAIDTSPDWRVVSYVIGLATTAGAAIILGIAEQLARTEALAAASAVAGAGGATPRQRPTTNRLITAQVGAATVAMLVGALVLQTVHRNVQFAPGFDAAHVAVGWIDGAGQNDTVDRNIAMALDAAGQAPGVTRAALLGGGPNSMRAFTDTLLAGLLIDTHGVTSAFFDTVGVGLTRGRSFSASEDVNGAAVAVINIGLAEAFWPGLDPVGRVVYLGGTTLDDAVRVIGVVPDVRTEGAGTARSHLAAYVPYARSVRHFTGRPPAAVLVRGPELAPLLVQRLRDGVGRLAPEVGFTAVRTMDEELRRTQGPAAVMAGVLPSLGALGLLMAITGLYGLMAFLATERHREFGIRRALGATPLHLVRMVAGEGLPLLGRGVGVGAILAVLIADWLRSRQFYTMQIFDPVPWFAVACVLLLAGLAGTVLPFGHILRGDAAEMLREK